MENLENKPYTLRNLEAKDVFTLVRVIQKAGVENFVDVFTNKDTEDKKTLGVKFISVLITMIGEIEEEIYSFLANLTGLTTKEIAELKPAVFMQMIYDVVESPEFTDFIQVAFKFAK